jgi:hypothetical protein
MSMTVTNLDNSSVLIRGDEFGDETLSFPGADTYAKGTILARKIVNDTVTPAADGGNTGDGTVTAATVVAGSSIPLAGAYNLEVTTAVTNGGVLKLEDPNGALVASDLTMTVGAGASTVFEAAGLQFTVTDGATDFVAGDKFSLTVTANGKLVVYSKTGAGGAQLPTHVITYEVTKAGSGDLGVRVLEAGLVRKDKLIIDDEAPSTVIDAKTEDELRKYSIFIDTVQELGLQDNQ